MSAARFRPRWCGTGALTAAPQVPMQIEALIQTRRRSTIPEGIARLAYDEYAARYGTDQSFERLHERGGFGVLEIVTLLADRVERLQSGRTPQ